MPAIDRPRTPAPHIREREEREAARNKLLALAADCADLGYRYRMLHTAKDSHVLSVWEPRTQHRDMRAICVLTGDGWQFHEAPDGPVIASAQDVAAPGDAKEAAAEIRTRITALAKRYRCSPTPQPR